MINVFDFDKYKIIFIYIYNTQSYHKDIVYLEIIDTKTNIFYRNKFDNLFLKTIKSHYIINSIHKLYTVIIDSLNDIDGSLCFEIMEYKDEIKLQFLHTYGRTLKYAIAEHIIEEDFTLYAKKDTFFEDNKYNCNEQLIKLNENIINNNKKMDDIINHLLNFKNNIFFTNLEQHISIVEQKIMELLEFVKTNNTRNEVSSAPTNTPLTNTPLINILPDTEHLNNDKNKLFDNDKNKLFDNDENKLSDNDENKLFDNDENIKHMSCLIA